MAGGQERVLRRRIRTVESTKKITRAMELIAASQIVRAQGRIAGSRPYIAAVGEVLEKTAEDSGNPTRLLGVPEAPEHVLVIAIVADRGLCGAYNSNVLRATERLIRAGTAEGRSYEVAAVGKKAQAYFRFRNQPVERQFVNMTDRPTFADARAVAEAVVGPFLAGDLDLVQIVSTRFISAGSQVVEVRQLLPLLPASLHHVELEPGVTPLMGQVARGGETLAEAGAGEYGNAGPGPKLGYFEFEPDAEELLERLVPQYVEAAIYGALLEASASEHTARQRAMSAATENAEELIKTLRRIMNRARQDSITTEIMEIVGGAEALRSGRDETPFTHPRATEEQTA